MFSSWTQHLLENPITRRVMKNSSYLFSATGISAAISMLQSALAARILGIAGYGILGTITVFTSVVNKFASFRMSELVIKYVGEYSEHGDHPRAAALFKAAALVEMLASILAFGLVWLLAPLGARYFAKDESLAGWFVVYGLIVLANLISESSTGLLQIFDRYRRMAFLNVIQSLFTLAIIGYAYLTGGGLLQVLLAYTGGKALGALGLTLAAIIEAGRHWGQGWWRAPLNLLRPQAGELAHFAFSTNLSATLSLINKDSELLWVSFFRPSVEVGYYKAALAIVNLVQLPISPLPQATYPELSREVARKNWSNLRYILRQGSILAGSFTLAATVGLFVLGKPVILLFSGSSEYLPAYPALLILLAGFLVANTFYWQRTALLSMGHPDFPTRVNLVLAVFKVLGAFLLVPHYGYLASAALLAGSYILGVAVSVFKLKIVLQQAEKS